MPVKRENRPRLVLVGLAAGLVLAIGAVVGVTTSGSDVEPAPPPAGQLAQTQGPIDMYSTAGVLELAEVVEEATGSTAILHAVLFEDWAVVTLRAHPGRSEAWNYTWRDGTFDSAGPATAADAAHEPFDLTDLNGDALPALCGTPLEDCVVVAGSPGPTDRGAWMKAVGTRGPQFTALSGAPVAGN